MYSIGAQLARPLRVSFKLRPAYGSLVIEGSDGATIKIDERAQGTAPRRFADILVGAHHVVLERDGKKIYDELQEIIVKDIPMFSLFYSVEYGALRESVQGFAWIPDQIPRFRDLWKKGR